MGGGTSSSKPIIKEFPGAYGTPDSERLAQQLEGVLGGNPSVDSYGSATYPESPYSGALQNAVLNPSYAPDTASETALINSIMDLAGGRSAVRGLGAPTAGGIAQSIAPALIDLRNQDISNLSNAKAQDTATQLQLRGQDLEQLLGVRAQDVGALLQLIGLAMPERVGGQSTKSASVNLCCFIFVEAYGGLLPIVRRYRDENMTDRNRRGYYRIADRIVPLMKKSKAFTWAVRILMTGPMVSYGKYYYKQGKIGKIFKPITKFWMGVFDRLGGDKPYVRKNGEVV